MHIPEDEAERRRLNERGREILRREERRCASAS